VNDRDTIRIDALPAGQAIEQSDGGRCGREQRRGNPVFVEQAQKVRPDIVITEVLVPKMDGLSLCRRIKADSNLQGTVVLIFSILAVQSRAEEAGADAFLMKPLAEQRLVDTVRQVLGKRRMSASTGDTR